MGTPFVGGGDTPDFEHAFSNCNYFQACGRFWLSSVQRTRRVADEKKKKKEKEESLVKYKSADMYVGWPK